jgi:hypothetical protein
VILIPGESGCHALLINSDAGSASGVDAVALPDVTYNLAVDRANALLTAQRRDIELIVQEWELHTQGQWHHPGPAGGGPQDRDHNRAAIFTILEWMWDAIAEPVLNALGHTRTPTGPAQEWPRVWWCPTGPLAVMPLHAAGYHPRDANHARNMNPDELARTVASRVVSSYTPTLAALVRARRKPDGPVAQLAIGAARAPGQSYLPGVMPELEAIRKHLPAPPARHLTGQDATAAAVLRALPACSWLHLSCHAFQHPDDPAASAFLLHDKPLTMGDLSAARIPSPDLAYLSACETASSDLRLIDESFHLASALQLIGFRHVLATLWPISDKQAPAMAEMIYSSLTRVEPDADRSAAALHEATARLRRAHPEDPLLWAPYIHLGP